MSNTELMELMEINENIRLRSDEIDDIINNIINN